MDTPNSVIMPSSNALCAGAAEALTEAGRLMRSMPANMVHQILDLCA